MDSVNVREMLIRNGWKVVEAKENEELRRKIAVMEQDLEEVSKAWYLETQKCESLERKCSDLKEIIKRKDELHELSLHKAIYCQQNADEWKQKYGDLLRRKEFTPVGENDNKSTLPKEEKQQAKVEYLPAPPSRENPSLVNNRRAFFRQRKNKPAEHLSLRSLPAPPTAKKPLMLKSYKRSFRQRQNKPAATRDDAKQTPQTIHKTSKSRYDRQNGIKVALPDETKDKYQTADGESLQAKVITARLKIKDYYRTPTLRSFHRQK